MILTIILNTLATIFENILNFLPNATILPFGSDEILVTGMGYIRFITTFFPPLATLITAFLIYIAFILALKIFRMIPIIRHVLD